MEYPIEFREQLLLNGWLPLPAVGKEVTIPGWPKQKISGEWLRLFNPSRYRSIGLRTDNLIAFDLDTDNPDLVGALVKAFPSKGSLEPLVRRRDGTARMIVVYRMGNDWEKAPAYKRSQKFEDPAGNSVMWEMLSGPGHQFIGYGERMIDTAAGKIRGSYKWMKGRGPNNTEVDDVCPLSVSDYEHLIADLDKIFLRFCQDREYPRVVSKGIEGEFAQRYALEWSTEFSVTGGSFDGAPTGVLSIEDAFKILEPMESDAFLTCHLDGVRPTSDSGAGRIRKDREGDRDILIADFAHRIIWRLAEAEPPSEELLAEGIQFPPELAKYFQGWGHLPKPKITDDFGGSFKIPSVPEGAQVQDGPEPVVVRTPPRTDGTITVTAPPPPSRARLKPDDWVFVASENSAFRLIAPTVPVGISGFKNLYGARVVQTWLSGQTHAETVYFDPEGAAGLNRRGAQVRLNQYLPPEWGTVPTSGGDCDTFFEFLAHLFPDRREHNIALDWIALKVARPWLRMHGLVLVAPRQGTGRGTLVHEILAPLLGPAYCSSVPLETLLGKTYQSQYTDFMDRSLIVYVEEAHDSSSSKANDWNARKQAYEKLKEIVDPSAKRMQIVRKGKSNTQEQVYASVIISTNHSDGLAISEGDRRFIVLTNGVPLHQNKDLHKRIHEWYKRPANLAALYAELVRMVEDGEVQYQPHGEAPFTQAKAQMINLNKSDIEVAVSEFVQEMRKRNLEVFDATGLSTAVRANLDHSDQTDMVIRRIAFKILRAQGLVAPVENEDGRQLRLRTRASNPPEKIYVLLPATREWADEPANEIKARCRDVDKLVDPITPEGVVSLDQF